MTTTAAPVPAPPVVPGLVRRYYRVALPAGMTLLNANSRKHNKAKMRDVQALRDAATLTALGDSSLNRAIRSAKPEPVLERAWIFGVVHSPRNIRLDPTNYYPSFKAAVDGIVRAGVISDDDDKHVLGPDMRRGPRTPGWQIVLHIYEAYPADWYDAEVAA
ncbi:hypothetical protein K378_01380 [Streptomyces sp. Amel2xB2]|uniref:hypothetical protein n=1 Tax=Streptomyces sp. Amel2xB2 TaxID=1305829 RepID=UPI000DB92784|nr:hypothetical protein [Streptomyces sp. Amel2xB2]RAJ70215.1 hypothetical protein K378_01380 [Streptomyces sp. Amel2xB2]